ncbi:MAG TPA: efflux RND transporter periplasmic adaptor subunit [Polyangia bacterium]|jgi:RND family efflux transporter MFP subunit|nr:efflux RND transporter periplasmic adaptor subunit [Polyangia bacterium]
MTNETEPESNAPSGDSRIPLAIGAGVALVLLLGGLMLWRADSRTNKVALASRPKPVTIVRARAATYRPSRTYVGTLEPWVQANVGPQLVSAYVDTVLVRPGAVVKRGDVLATLDCRDASASTKAIAARARSIDAHQKAIADEASRTQGLLNGGFVSPNEAEQKNSQSVSEEAQLESERATLARSSLQVNDCILRSPFAGEVAQRFVDPGAFVRPGSAIVTVVDRSTVRMTADAPEIDFALIPPGAAVKVHIYATNRDFQATITRRAPAADPATRTVHFEIDVPDPARSMPVGTTAEVHIGVGTPTEVTQLPLYAATVRGETAKVFVVDHDVARAATVAVKGEEGGALFVDSSLPPGAAVVAEGRAQLEDGDRVEAKEMGEIGQSAARGDRAPTAEQGRDGAVMAREAR